MRFIGNNLSLGNVLGSGGTFDLDPDELSTHVGIFGRSGRGKSKLVEYLVRQIVEQWPSSRSGCLVLDPHGPVFDGVLAHAASRNVRRPIVPIDLRDPAWVVAYNLLRPRQGARDAVVVDALVEAVLHAWGAADADATPLLARWSGNLFHALYHLRATLADAMHLLMSPMTRRHVAEALASHPLARDWYLAADLREADLESMVSSTVNRLRRFLGNETLRLMFGQPGASLDLGQAIAEGWIVLVCLATENANISRENSDLVGSLLLSDLWTSAALRGKRDRLRQFVVVADEFQRFLTPSIADGLDQSRGFGLAWVLSCQYPRQALFKGGTQGEHLLASLMENVGTKVTFQLTHEENLKSLAPWMVYGLLDPDRIKHEIYATRVLGHVEERRRTITTSESTTETDSHSTTTQHGTTEGEGEDWQVDAESGEGEYVPGSRSTSTTHMEGETSGSSTGRTVGKSGGEQFFLRPVMGVELASRQYKPIDEQLFEAQQLIFRLPQRRALARSGDMPGPVIIEVPWLAEGAGRHYAGRYTRRTATQFPFVLPAVASSQLQTRQKALIAQLNGEDQRADDPPMGRRVPKSPKGGVVK